MRVVKEEQGYGFPGAGTVDFATSVLLLNVSSWDSGEQTGLFSSSYFSCVLIKFMKVDYGVEEMTGNAL